MVHCRVRHRGPDWSGVSVSGQNILCHERLAIVGVDSGAQPLTNHDNTVILSVNGEIYNYVELQKQLKGKYEFKTQSDCEVILYLVIQVKIVGRAWARFGSFIGWNVFFCSL